MHGRDGRFGFGIGVVCLLAAAGSAGAVTIGRDGTRNFPHTSWCPFEAGGGVEFLATGKTATVTFVACDNVSMPLVLEPCPCSDGSSCDPSTNTCADGTECSSPDPDPTLASAKLVPIDVRIDSIRIVRRDVFNDSAHRVLNEFTEPPQFGFGADCSWGSVFDPSTTRAFSRAMPFLDEISEATESTWALGNAEAKTFGQDWQLVLADGESVPAPPLSASSIPSCSAASFSVGGLSRDETYVLDFNWWVSGNLETIGQGSIVMRLFIDTDPGP